MIQMTPRWAWGPFSWASLNMSERSVGPTICKLSFFSASCILPCSISYNLLTSEQFYTNFITQQIKCINIIWLLSFYMFLIILTLYRDGSSLHFLIFRMFFVILPLKCSNIENPATLCYSLLTQSNCHLKWNYPIYIYNRKNIRMEE